MLPDEDERTTSAVGEPLAAGKMNALGNGDIAPDESDSCARGSANLDVGVRDNSGVGLELPDCCCCGCCSAA